MKWFKHISDSLDDPFIFDLMDRFGPMGYLVFFGTMEIYAREYKPENGWKLRATLSYLRSKLRSTRYQLMVNPLLYIAERGKWEVDIQGDEVSIFIPKFREFMDEHTRKTSSRKIPKNSGVTPESLRCKEAEVEVEEDIKSKNKKPQSALASGFSKLDSALQAPIQAACEKLVGHWPGVFAWVNQKKSTLRHDAILFALEQVLEHKPKKPHPYATKIATKESQNRNEAESMAEAEEMKNIDAGLLDKIRAVKRL